MHPTSQFSHPAAQLGGHPVARGCVTGCELLRIDQGPGLAPTWQLVGPPPRLPTLILGAADRETAFADLPALARAVHRLRKGRAIRIAARARARDQGATTFPSFDIFAIGPFGDERWLCGAAIQTKDREVLQAALEAACPQDGFQ